MELRRKTDIPIKPAVLVVDDDSKNRFALQETLEELDCTVIEAQSGIIALEITLKEPIALILLDVQMPDMDGFEVASLLKKHNETKEIPIIFITAYSKDEKHIQYGHMIGGVDYILKPFDPMVLLKKVSSYLDTYKQKILLKNQVQNLDTARRYLSYSNNQLKNLSEHDSLTGLLNRKGFDIAIHEATTLAKEKNSLLALFYIDLDNFKSTNDTYGHNIGDELLKIVATRLKDTVRENDVIGEKNNDTNISRFGGDEFSILLIDIPSSKIAHTVADRLLKNFSNHPILINGHEINIGISIGISLYPQDGQSIETLCKHADEAMYQAKRSGKHTYSFYSNKLKKEIEFNKTLTSTLEKSLNENDFYIVYQPIYNLYDNTIVAAESLSRLKHPSLGYVTPNQFIPILEKSSLVERFDEWILHQVTYDFNQLPDSLKTKFYFSINFSMHELYSKKIIESIKSALTMNQINPHQIELELSESILDNDSKIIQNFIYSINELGIRVAIDHFGTGNLSLKRLKELPISTIKIDQSLIAEIDQKENDNTIILTILDIARNLNITTIAEGITTIRQRDFLVGHGCHYGQGFLKNKPLSLPDLITKITESGVTER